MKASKPIQFNAVRFYSIVVIIVIATLGLIFRIIDLCILNQPFLLSQGNERVLRQVSSPAFRGMVLDRNGIPLAISTSVYSVWVDPKGNMPSRENILIIARKLNLNPKETLALLNKRKNKDFVYLKRGVAPDIARKLQMQHLPGIYFQKEYKRFYPEGEVTAHVVGFTNVDDQGQEGLELSYNRWLGGVPGKKWVIKDRLGRTIADAQTIKEQKPGRDLVLSIDRRIQYLAYHELANGVIANKAKSGSAVVLDAHTGEVLAMVNYPSYNPNNLTSRARADNVRNRAVTDSFEPGSTIKAFSLASALEHKVIKPDSIIDTNPGWVRLNHKVFRDEKNYGLMSVTNIMQRSSNVGMTKIILTLPQDSVWEVLHRCGFGEMTGIGFPGEQAGLLTMHYPWTPITLATLAFGYGLSTTTLQLANAYGILANEGYRVKPTLLKMVQPPARIATFDGALVQQILQILEAVVLEGSGKKSSVVGYRVAGKTGTSWQAGKHGYGKKHSYTSSFVGVAPLSHPQIVVAVIVQTPLGKEYFGGLVAGPIFSKIMAGTLRTLEIPPDAQT